VREGWTGIARAPVAASRNAVPDEGDDGKTREAYDVTMRYHIFLSYHRADAAVVTELAERLRREGIEPWLDLPLHG
jgi:hypothetical protein